MIQFLVLLLGFFLTYQIFKNKGNYVSLLWVIIPSLLINDMVIITEIPIKMSISRWLIFSLLFTEVIQWKRFKYNWGNFPLKKIVILLIIGSLAVGIFDPRLSLFYKLYNPFCEMTDAYFILFLGYFVITDRDDLDRLKKPIYLVMLIVALYGIFNFVTKINPYYQLVVDNFFQGGERDISSKMGVLDTTRDRFRSVSTFSMTFTYGYASTLIAIYYLYELTGTTRGKNISKIGLVCGLIGTILCFSRTVLFAGVLSLVVYALFPFRSLKILKTIFMLFLCVIFLYITIPVVQESIDNTLDVFITGGEKIGGSSVSMREVQLVGTYYYFMRSPIRGNGYRYISEELGWGDRDHANLDKSMKGFESIIYQLMIEQGLIGLVTKLVLFISLIIYYIRQRKVICNKYLSGLGIAITVLFFSFSVGTGPLGMWPLTMLFLGAVIKAMQLNKQG